MSKTKRLLGFEPTYTIADSIESIKEWIDAGGLAEQDFAADETYGLGTTKKESAAEAQG